MLRLNDPSHAPTPLLRHPPFTLFWSSRVLSTLALHMQTVAVGWQLYDLTPRALDLGLVGLVQFVPTIVLTPLVGQAADRYDGGAAGVTRRDRAGGGRRHGVDVGGASAGGRAACRPPAPPGRRRYFLK